MVRGQAAGGEGKSLVVAVAIRLFAHTPTRPHAHTRTHVTLSPEAGKDACATAVRASLILTGAFVEGRRGSARACHAVSRTVNPEPATAQTLDHEDEGDSLRRGASTISHEPLTIFKGVTKECNARTTHQRQTEGSHCV